MGRMSLAIPPPRPYVPASLGPRGRSRPTGCLLVWGYVMNALAQLGMVSELPSENQTTMAHCSDAADAARKDYFIERDGERFAGVHLLADLWDARNLEDPEHID